MGGSTTTGLFHRPYQDYQDTCMFHQAEGAVQWFGEKKSRVSDAVELMIHEKYLSPKQPTGYSQPSATRESWADTKASRLHLDMLG